MLQRQLETIRQVTAFAPEIGIVLGSGLGGFAAQMNIVAEIPYGRIPELPISTAPSHKGKLLFGYIGDKKAVVMQGRLHLYEGYTAEEAVRPIRLMHALGAKTLLLTNAAGGINRHFHAGDFMLIEDHISAFVPSPLIGKNDDAVGPRFPDMSNVYDCALKRIFKQAAKENDIELKSGVYVQLTGPQFETPAEIKMLASLGADAVGMSTVTEAIAAKHCGMRVCGISLITNLASGILDKPLSGEEIGIAASSASPQFERLITAAVRNM